MSEFRQVIILARNMKISGGTIFSGSTELSDLFITCQKGLMNSLIFEI
jgi:hypothetical protein